VALLPGQGHFSFCIYSSYNHDSLGHSHDTHVFGEYIPGPNHVRNSSYLLFSPLILCSARIFLGLAEGGLFPGVAYYLSIWYPRQMQAKRIAIFFSAAIISGAFSGMLAYTVRHLEGWVTCDSRLLSFTESDIYRKAGLHGWQWIVRSYILSPPFNTELAFYKFLIDGLGVLLLLTVTSALTSTSDCCHSAASVSPHARCSYYCVTRVLDSHWPSIRRPLRFSQMMSDSLLFRRCEKTRMAMQPTSVQNSFGRPSPIGRPMCRLLTV
jgi:MFS family permease